MDFGGLTARIDPERGIVFVNKEEWEGLPEELQEVILSRLQEDYPDVKLTVQVTDGDPEDEGDDEQIQVNNLLIPDDVRIALLHYRNGVVTAVRTTRGWVQILENGQHKCGLPSPYNPDSPPVTIAILTKFPNGEPESIDVDALSDEIGKVRPWSQQPMFLDLSDSVEEISVRSDAWDRVNRLIGERTREVRESLASEALQEFFGGRDLNEASFERFYRMTAVVDDVVRAEGWDFMGEYFTKLGSMRALLHWFVLTAGAYDWSDPEAGWVALLNAHRRMVENPVDAISELGVNTNGFNYQPSPEDERGALEELWATKEFKNVEAALREGAHSADWVSDFYSLRMGIISSMFEAAGEEE